MVPFYYNVAALFVYRTIEYQNDEQRTSSGKPFEEWLQYRSLQQFKLVDLTEWNP